MSSTYTPETYRLPYPTHCPGCGSQLRISPPHLLCLEDSCPEKLKGRLKTMANRDHLDIQGLGESVADALVAHGFVRTLADVWRLTEGQVASVPFGNGLYGSKRAASLIKAIGASNRHPWSVVLHSLAVGTGLGAPEAERISERYSLNDLVAVMHPVALKLELKNIEGVGEETANSFVTWLNANAGWLYEFHENGWLQTHYVVQENVGPKPLAGSVFMLTGGFSDRSARSAYEKRLKALGAEVKGSVTKKTTHVVAGASAPTEEKLEAARKLGIAIWDESQLKALLGEHANG